MSAARAKLAQRPLAIHPKGSDSKGSQLELIISEKPQYLYTFDRDKFISFVDEFLFEHSSAWSYAVQWQNAIVAIGSHGCRVFPSTNNTVFHSPTKQQALLSTSKPFSAVAMLKLLREKGISIDTKIGDFLPPATMHGDALITFDGDCADITFRMLLNHTTALCDAKDVTNLPSARSDDVLLTLSKYKKSNPFPLVVPRYLNIEFSLLRVLAYFLLGNPPLSTLIAYRGCGKFFAEYIQSTVLVPSGILRTDTWSSAGVNIYFAYQHPHEVYATDEGIALYELSGVALAGPSGLFLSPLEVLQFSTALYTGKLLAGVDLAEMHTFSAVSMYGLGIERVESAKYKSWPGKVVYFGHSGDLYKNEAKAIAVRSRWIAMPETGFGVSILTNCCDGLNGTTLPSKDLRYHLCDWLDQCLTRKVFSPPSPGI